MAGEVEGPRRVQLSRMKGWRMPENTVVVARPSRWGNPWRVVRSGRFSDGAQAWSGRHDWELNYPHVRDQREAAQRAVTEFRSALTQGHLTRFTAEDVRSLRGKNLACWCALDQPCHADVLLEMANG